jgi:hypothetical protein
VLAVRAIKSGFVARKFEGAYMSRNWRAKNETMLSCCPVTPAIAVVASRQFCSNIRTD